MVEEITWNFCGTFASISEQMKSMKSVKSSLQFNHFYLFALEWENDTFPRISNPFLFLDTNLRQLTDYEHYIHIISEVEWLSFPTEVGASIWYEIEAETQRYESYAAKGRGTGEGCVCNERAVQCKINGTSETEHWTGTHIIAA